MSRFLSAFFFLDDSREANGTIECAPNYHRALLTEPGIIADPDDSLLGASDRIDAKAGDVLVSMPSTPHRSGPNRSQRACAERSLFTYGVDPRPDLYAIYKQFQQKVRS